MEVNGEFCSPPRFWPWIFGQGQTSKVKAITDCRYELGLLLETFAV